MSRLSNRASLSDLAALTAGCYCNRRYAIRTRIAYNTDGIENAGSTLYYSFDSAGHFVRQVSATNSMDTSFDYSCWAH
jgi:hypothetical protein